MQVIQPGYRVELVAAEPLVCDPAPSIGGRMENSGSPKWPTTRSASADGEEAAGEEASLKVEGRRLMARQMQRTINPQPKGGGRVRFLEDTDCDGRYDKSTVFLGKLNFPNGVMAWRDGVLISAAPGVLFVRDTNGDGHADEVKVLLAGFGEENQQHRVNGFS
ncbi:MAG TPA: hypothetical protein VK137_05375, partial [Planctomycetaceae bacterium]|nr:hypothetical protein [Planctomycetaceae bacterium]